MVSKEFSRFSSFDIHILIGGRCFCTSGRYISSVLVRVQYDSENDMLHLAALLSVLEILFLKAVR